MNFVDKLCCEMIKKHNHIKSNRGGVRKGAGRPKGEPTTTIAFRVKVKHVEELRHKIKQLIKLQNQYDL